MILGLVGLKDLVQVREQGVRDSSVLLLALIFLAELEDLPGGGIIELEKFVVGSQGVQDCLRNVEEVLDLGHDLALLLQLVEASVGQEDNLFTSGFVLVDDCGVLVLVTEVLDQLFLTDLLLELEEDSFALVSEEVHNLREEVHGLVLTEVSEIADVLLEVESRVVLGANLNHRGDELLKNTNVVLGFPVLDSDMEYSKSVLPVAFLEQLVSELVASLGRSVGADSRGHGLGHVLDLLLLIVEAVHQKIVFNKL